MSDYNETLRALNEKALTIIHKIQDADGELDAETETELAVVEEQIERKIDGYNAMFTMLEAEDKRLTEIISSLSLIRKKVRDTQDRMKDGVLNGMKTLGRPTMKGQFAEFKAYLSGKSKLIVSDISLIPQEYFKTVTTVSLDEETVKTALAQGLEVPGCSIEAGWSFKRSAIAAGRLESKPAKALKMKP